MNHIQLTLQKKLVELKAKNPRLSDRYFAQRLGLSSGALSEILKGKRRISEKLATRLAEKLNMDPKEREQFLSSLKTADGRKDLGSIQLEDDQFHMVSDWSHFAILNLIKSRSCGHQVTWFAERLNLPNKVVRESLDRLERLGLIEFEKSKYRRTKAHLHTSDGILNLSIRKSNYQDLDLIGDQLNHLSADEIDFSSTTMLIDSRKFKECRAWIRKFQDRFGVKFETAQSETVFRLTTILFPLKKPHLKESK